MPRFIAAQGVYTRPYRFDRWPVAGKSALAHLFELFDKIRQLEKIYESEGIGPKLCSYRPVEGKSTVAHLFELIDNTRKLEKLYEYEGTTPRLGSCKEIDPCASIWIFIKSGIFLLFTVETTFLTFTVETTFTVGLLKPKDEHG